MDFIIDKELLGICMQIVNAKKTKVEWASIESDDYFQNEPYEGGFDATEDAFCFSYYAPDDEEYWFQLTLEEIQDISSGNILIIKIRKAS